MNYTKTILILLIVIAFSLSVFVSCYAPVKKNLFSLPYLSNAWQISETPYEPDAKDVSYVISIFYKEWRKKFGDRNNRVKRALNQIMIEWGSEEKIAINAGYNVRGERARRAKIKGLALSKGYIWVYIEPGQKISTTSLTHELVHIALWASGVPNGDEDHEGNKTYGWTKEHSRFIIIFNDSISRLKL